MLAFTLTALLFAELVKVLGDANMTAVTTRKLRGSGRFLTEPVGGTVMRAALWD